MDILRESIMKQGAPFKAAVANYYTYNIFSNAQILANQYFGTTE